MIDKSFKRSEKFDRLSREQGLEEKLPKLKVYAIRYHPPKGEAPGTKFKIDEFKSEAERKKWYEKEGKAIERVDGGKMEFYEED
ncbi:MAG: hypothetical protein HZB99_03995 [Candidatus Harrisonbacteria bacterium]|nr:hypothetical protein [Candidatus Harrisonbacteria bacterium]